MENIVHFSLYILNTNLEVRNIVSRNQGTRIGGENVYKMKYQRANK